MKPIINSEKHYVHFPVATITNGARTNFTVVGVDNQLTNASDVRAGAAVKAIYLELWAAASTEFNLGQISIQKQPGEAPSPTFTEMQNMGTYGNKKNVLEFHQGLMPSNGNIIPLFRQWIMIPKGKQRQGLGDQIKFSVAAIGADLKLCGFSTFKEYF